MCMDKCHIAKHTNYYGFDLHGMCLNLSNETYYVGKKTIYWHVLKNTFIHLFYLSVKYVAMYLNCIFKRLAVFVKSLEPVIAFSYCEIGAGLKLFIFCWGGGVAAQCAQQWLHPTLIRG